MIIILCTVSLGWLFAGPPCGVTVMPLPSVHYVRYIDSQLETVNDICNYFRLFTSLNLFGFVPYVIKLMKVF